MREKAYFVALTFLNCQVRSSEAGQAQGFRVQRYTASAAPNHGGGCKFIPGRNDRYFSRTVSLISNHCVCLAFAIYLKNINVIIPFVQ